MRARGAIRLLQFAADGDAHPLAIAFFQNEWLDRLHRRLLSLLHRLLNHDLLDGRLFWCPFRVRLVVIREVVGVKEETVRTASLASTAASSGGRERRRRHSALRRTKVSRPARAAPLRVSRDSGDRQCQKSNRQRDASWRSHGDLPCGSAPRHLGRAAIRLDQSSLAYTCSARGAIAARHEPATPPAEVLGGRAESMQGIRQGSTNRVDNQIDNSVVAPHEPMVSLWTVRLAVGRIGHFYLLLPQKHFVNKSVAAILSSRRPRVHNKGPSDRNFNFGREPHLQRTT